jgi:glutathione peroxidase
MMSIYDFSAKDAQGNERSLSEFKGKVVLIVNTASKCGFTPQYKGLQELYSNLHGQGFEIIGFPCDQFGHQEPGTDAEIQQFCELNYNVSFPVFSKIEVNGRNTHPLYKYLKSLKKGTLGSRIEWNFTKFLVDRDGNLVNRYASNITPEKLALIVASELEKPSAQLASTSEKLVKQK